MITLTENASKELADMLNTRTVPAGTGLRLAVRRGGCAGWQYEMSVATPEADDVIIEEGGARVILAADSLDRLKGCAIDHSNDLTDAGFKIINPNAARSCGCGTSFEAADEPVGAHAVPDGEACGSAD